jgi:hypothetical protein
VVEQATGHRSSLPRLTQGANRADTVERRL